MQTTETTPTHVLTEDELWELDKALDIGTRIVYDRDPTAEERADWHRYSALVLSGRRDDLVHQLVSMIAYDDDRLVTVHAGSFPYARDFFLSLGVVPDWLEGDDDAST